MSAAEHDVAARTVEGKHPYDPLRLCVYATIAGLGWMLGPVALIFFAGLGLLAYTRARLAGLTSSRCLLRDTRLVITYLCVLVGLGVWGVVRLFV